MRAYYNENDPFAAAWLRNLIAEGLIAKGDVDERSIVDVTAGDVTGYCQCHFFAGIGGWSYALRLAGWSDSRPCWTGSCPCQPFSHAGKQRGVDDERHLYPFWFSLIQKCRPPVVFGEQVTAAIAHGWLDTIYQGMEAEGYAVGAAILPACSVGAPHKRDRLWFVADSGIGRCNSAGEGEVQQQGRAETFCASDVVAYTNNEGSQGWDCAELPERAGEQFVGARDSSMADSAGRSEQSRSTQRDEWRLEEEILRGRRYRSHDWKIEPAVGRVADGIPARVGRLRAYGNAIVPQVAAEFIAAFMDCAPNQPESQPE